MGEGDLKAWVSDQLHNILGYSHAHVADFVVSLAKHERSAQTLLAKLSEADIPETPASRRFAVELLGRLPRLSAGSELSASERQRREAAKLLKENEKYEMVSYGDEEEDEVTASVQRALKQKERERERAEKEAQKEQKRQKKRERNDAPAASISVGDAGDADGEEAERQREVVRNYFAQS